jgi:tryptophan synthase beta chain
MEAPTKNLVPTPSAAVPTSAGTFGIFGGRFVAETLMPLILDLEKAYAAAKADPAFPDEMNGLSEGLCRPAVAALFRRAPHRASRRRKIYFKREELNHTGSHKVNNVLGQIMVARRMGKKRIIAETGAGQHGVATATLVRAVRARMRRLYGRGRRRAAAPNVIRMEMLGAKVIPVQSGTRTLKDAMNEALRDWVTNVPQHLLLHRHGRRAASLSR